MDQPQDQAGQVPGTTPADQPAEPGVVVPPAVGPTVPSTDVPAEEKPAEPAEPVAPVADVPTPAEGTGESTPPATV